MKKFPVRIDLSTFFEDERKFVIILVDPQWKSVEYLQHRVEEIFDVRPVHFLTIDNLFIPPQESIEVIEFTESLKAFIPKHAVEESRRRSKKISKAEDGNDPYKSKEIPIKETTIKKRKYHTLGIGMLGSSTPNQTKKSRPTSVAVPNSPAAATNESQEITSTNGEYYLYKEDAKVKSNKSKDVLSPKNNKINYSDVDNRNIPFKEDEEQRSIGKRKKTRSTKNVSVGQKNYNLEPTNQTVNSKTIRTEIPSSTFLKRSKSRDKETHIYFDDNSTLESSINNQASFINTSNTFDKNKSSTVIFKCNLNDVDSRKPLVFPLNIINKNRQALKPIIDIQENILLPPANIDILTKTSILKELCTSITKKNESDSQVETVDEKSNSDNEKERNAGEMLTGTELNPDEKDAPVETTNNKQESSALNQTKLSNASVGSNNSLALDESCVIDLDDDDEEVINLSDAEDQQQSLKRNGSSIVLETLNNNISAMSVNEMLPFCIPLTGIPSVGDIVIFKFSRQALGEKSDVSEFIACKCEHVNRRTKVLKLSIIDASLEGDLIPQHLTYNLDESVDNRFMSIKFPEMIDPNVLES